ncbi:hypothetical protein HYPSUDRAFT_46693 [Hypholoma sublateritium FD-334 SS-4]|uniref:Amidohydrolase 3 domain-containing protein n=1 Tax=Hypholoma sublateritium (strain FD-334 SS-4) TaxID=945553 RepID=A0A0D2NDP1_HYPSF|nr:hypothetical protein HYPSUDRAFT_46693 [Hypholoma sublateritium FD-334 SS-4]
MDSKLSREPRRNLQTRATESNSTQWWARRLIFGVALSAGLVFLNYPLQSSYAVCSPSRNIYTVDDTAPRVECIAVRNARIARVGSYDEVVRPQRYFEGNNFFPRWLVDRLAVVRYTMVIYLHEDAILVPGLADAHAHVIENGYMNQLPLMGAASVQEVVDRIKTYIATHSDTLNEPSRWIEGMGWDQTKWPGAQFPTAADLATDPLLKGRLISLSRVDGHARWVSPAVLELMPNLPEQVEGGLIVRDAEGNPTGVFVDNAMDLIPIPPWSEKQITEFFDMTMKQALSYGLTSIHDADTKPAHIAFFQKLADAGKLPNRLYLMGNNGSAEYWGDTLPKLVDYGKHARLNLRSVKLIADGALGSWGAALLEPYSDDLATSGLMLSSPEKLERQIRRFWADGWQTNVHCIGDRANHVILDIYERILAGGGRNVTESRPRIEHAQIFTPADLVRIGKLGVIASVQPTHATSDMGYAQIRLGPDRIKGAYAYQTLLKASPQGVLPLGSDFPIEGVNPLLGFYAATSRLYVDGTSPHGLEGWFSEQKLTRAQALKGMTLDAAYASFAEHDLGSLTPGKKADFVVFDKDIMTVPYDKILEAKVVATVIDGEVAYGTL